MSNLSALGISVLAELLLGWRVYDAFGTAVMWCWVQWHYRTVLSLCPLLLSVTHVVAVDVIKEPLLLYKLLTTSSPAGCAEPPSAEAADSSHARGHLPDLSYDDSQYSLVVLEVALRSSVCFTCFCFCCFGYNEEWLSLVFIGGFSYTSTMSWLNLKDDIHCTVYWLVSTEPFLQCSNYTHP